MNIVKFKTCGVIIEVDANQKPSVNAAKNSG